MKYLTYIIKGSPLQPELLISDRRYLREITVIVVLPASLIGVIAIGCLLPWAAIMDLIRLTKLRYLLWQRREGQKCYVRCVLRSLGHEVTSEGMRMLLVA